ncbi:hypothetical protein CFHF_18460 [Caulobacter flavus]|jgi:hypothetical protein|uniref:Uncharacterized protein n=1 Tax=Caulobacter flavus TaxID=1679497 RepID=A0A2N5CPQ3_9CAUL|nr:hypothetical protein [Caulobacter flavus]PLR09126.1 hypothetical protein CFHF_18460 [Caulobacter flavus]
MTVKGGRFGALGDDVTQRGGNPGFDDDASQFVVMQLWTVEALQLLLLMRGAANRTWSTSSLANALQVDPDMVDEIVRRLCALGLIVEKGKGWFYRPSSAGIKDLCARVEVAYRQRPSAMAGLMGRGRARLDELADAPP